MAYLSKLQVIQRGGQNRQYYLICPAPVAAALEMEKGEALEWVIKDRNTLVHPQSLYLDSCNPNNLRMKNSSSR